ncbi:hypothetical protein CMI40_01450 [Candidatus Pacearchaeota archaeon]|jgi:ERCC4-type nuclease|nr:hypothetical protein [Candidatus Pacearchaeota archaeon]|tara:strand:+ start:12940 stop:13623 length:684 start_codon:yes stop_codon:yes gene_type:complete
MKQIFNLFSRQPLKIKKEKSKIIVDYRERNSLVPSELISLGFHVEFKALKIADYIVNDVVIERKTVTDFISSIINRRLLSQIIDLQQYENKLLIVEGIDEQELYNNSEERIGMNPNAIRGFLLSILLKYKIPLIFTKNYEDTAKFISVLSKKKSKEIPLNVRKKSFNKKEQMQYILESFPGIGPTTSKKLLEKFKTIKEIINAPYEDLQKIIGKKAEILRKIINETY